MKHKIPFHLGFSCNFTCRHCYFSRSRGRGDFPLWRIKFRLKALRLLGFDNLDLIGGEPTVRGDIREIIGYAKRIGYGRISLTTNGYRLADPEFFGECAKSGLNDVTFSLLGGSPSVHDGNTGVEGGFDRLFEAVGNARMNGLTFGVHYVVMKNNLADIAQAVDRLIGFRPARFEFLYLDPGFDVSIEEYRELVPRYSDAAEHVEKGLKRLVEAGVRARIVEMPFCILPDFAQYTTSNLKFPEFTEDEGYWALKEALLKNPLDPLAQVIKGLPFISYGDLKKTPLDFLSTLHMRGLLRDTHTKARGCGRCKMDLICCGVWKQYEEIHGLEELAPVV
jgi:MoaA/NifB/PqqE/SkfB family radical SAM enzyme